MCSCSSRRRGSVSSRKASSSPARARVSAGSVTAASCQGTLSFVSIWVMTSRRFEIRRSILRAPGASTDSSNQSSNEWRIEMGKIVVSTNVTLDGVVQDPDGGEGFERGGWFVQFGGQDLEQWAGLMAEEAQGAAALLLGRRSDEWFASRWTSRDGEWADRLNGLPKYVVSSTLAAPRWTNATVLKGDAVDEATKLKGEVDGEIVVYASYPLVRALLEAGLVDELRLTLFPVV